MFTIEFIIEMLLPVLYALLKRVTVASPRAM